MNKKILAGMIIGVLGIFLVTAALVDYLSNTSSVGITVDSPFETAFWDGDGWSKSAVLVDVVGGDTFMLESRVKSLTSIDADVDVKIVITNDKGTPRCEDFSNLYIYGSNTGLVYDGPVAGHSLCVENHGAETVTITIPAFYLAGEHEYYTTAWSFDLAVEPATYNIDATIMVPTTTPA